MTPCPSSPVNLMMFAQVGGYCNIKINRKNPFKVFINNSARKFRINKKKHDQRERKVIRIDS